MLGKRHWRQRIWEEMQRRGVALFPGAVGRIPNFVGAEQAAARLAGLPEWKAARTLKCNPDSPQRAVRAQAMREGKRVYMAVPRLRQQECFIELDPARLGQHMRAAASISGAARFGRPVLPEQVPAIDLVVAGSVVVNRKGVRIGKGGGYSDIEYALGREFGFLREETPIVTTVHPLQVVDDDLPFTEHDFDLDIIVTPEEVIRVSRRRPRPCGILWRHLDEGYLSEIPVLSRLAAGRRD